MRHYCTLFDSKYLPQGLVLYESLKKHSSEQFTLHVLAMDDKTVDYLLNTHTPSMKVTNLRVLRAVTGLEQRGTWQEFCWMMASQWSEFLMVELWLPEITYLDADMMFFSDPKVIHDEIGDRSIAVIPHRLIPSKRHLEVNGQFNVSWVTFKNDPIGRECLSTWAWQCREKCSATDGCGDQKYLDAWPDKYGPELAIIQNVGAGLAPWNLANYDAYCITASMKPYVDEKPVVFYHYHEFKERSDGTFQLTNYELRPEDIKLIYEPYLEAYRTAQKSIQELTISK